MNYIAVCFVNKDNRILIQLHAVEEGLQVDENLLEMYKNLTQFQYKKFFAKAVDINNLHNDLVTLINNEIIAGACIAPLRKMAVDYDIQIAAILAIVNGYVNPMLYDGDYDTHCCMGTFNEHTVSFIHDGNADGYYYQIHQHTNSEFPASVEELQNPDRYALLSVSEVHLNTAEPNYQPNHESPLNEAFDVFLDVVHLGELRFQYGPPSSLTKEKVQAHRKLRGLPDLNYETEGYESDN